VPKSADRDLERDAIPLPLLSGSDRKTYEALFHHPSSNNLKWHDVIHLFERFGSVGPSNRDSLRQCTRHICSGLYSKTTHNEWQRDIKHRGPPGP